MKCPCKRGKSEKISEAKATNQITTKIIAKPKKAPPPPPVQSKPLKHEEKLNVQQYYSSTQQDSFESENTFLKEQEQLEEERVILTTGTGTSAVLGAKKFKKVAGMAPYVQGPTLQTGASMARYV